MTILAALVLAAACSSGSDDDAADAPDDSVEAADDDVSDDDADADDTDGAGPAEDEADASDEPSDADDTDDTDDADDVDDPGDADESAPTTTSADDDATTTTIESGDEGGVAPTTTAGGGSSDPAPTTTAAPTTTTPPAPSGYDSAGARRSFDAVVADFTPADGFIDLPDCPLDPTGELLTGTFAGMGEAEVVAAVDSPPENGIFDIGAGFGPMLTCDRFSEEDADSVGLFALAPPADLNAYASWFANPDEDEGITISVEPTVTVEGGTINRICGLDEFSDDFDFCEVDWVSDDIVIGVYVSGPVATTVDLAALEAGLISQLETIVNAFST